MITERIRTLTLTDLNHGEYEWQDPKSDDEV